MKNKEIRKEIKKLTKERNEYIKEIMKHYDVSLYKKINSLQNECSHSFITFNDKSKCIYCGKVLEIKGENNELN